MRRLFKKLKRIIEKNLRSETIPYADLDRLIRRAEERYQRISRGVFPPICSHCDHAMELRHSNIAGGGFSGCPVGSPIRDDQGYKCTNCYHTCHFGLPISKREAQQEIRLRGGTKISRPSQRRDEAGREDIKKRLKELGYFDFGEQETSKHEHETQTSPFWRTINSRVFLQWLTETNS